MGLYDTVHSQFPLPHHQDAEYQTKDMEHLVGGVSGLGGTLSEYEITPEGGLRVRVHEREWRDDPEWFGGGYLESKKDWWEDIPDVHGDIHIYTRDADEFVEFRIRFTDGEVSRIDEIDRATS
ncbi:MAG: hypothetical protein ACLFRT_10780 [Actinomycetota bacterium]